MLTTTPPPLKSQHSKSLKETVPNKKVHGDNVHKRVFLHKLVLNLHSYFGSVMQCRAMNLPNIKDRSIQDILISI